MRSAYAPSFAAWQQNGQAVIRTPDHAAGRKQDKSTLSRILIQLSASKKDEYTIEPIILSTSWRTGL